MNFFDAYDVSGTATPPTNQPEQSLNEEVSQVVGQLTRFWGGFRKQSQTAFEAARKDIGEVVSQAQKDLGEVVSQAQKELTKLTAEAPPSTATAENSSPSPSEQPSPGPSTETEPLASSSESTSTETASATEDSNNPRSISPESQPQTLFARLQASLPPNLVATVQSQLPESLQHARTGSLSAIDFAQLRSTLTAELQRVQGATEEYVQRSEDILREAGEFLKDAVRVVPPEEGGATGAPGSPGVVWDGTDVWMLPMSWGGDTSGKGKGKEKEGRSSSSSGRPSVDGLRAVATRAESLLKQLRYDPEVIRVDPEADEKVRQLYENWVATAVSSKEDGIDGAEWKTAIEKALADPVDGQALSATKDVLVPSVMPIETFWIRYFFRVYQVEQEEARRKAIIQGTVDNEEDFSWEDDDDDPKSPITKTVPATLHPPPVGSPPVNPETPAELSSPLIPLTPVTSALSPTAHSYTSTPGNQSPRQSSEDSYDVVSSQVSNNGSGVETKADAKAVEGEKEEAGDDADSDWE